MLTKIYFALLLICILAMSFFAYYSWSWLQSIGKPQTAVENFDFWSNYFSIAFWATSFILLIVANIILWTRKSAWALWVTLGYFAIFTLLNYFWLGETYFQFKKANNLWEGGFSVGSFVGVGLCLAAAAVIFLNQFIGFRLHEKMFPSPSPELKSGENSAINNQIEEVEN